MKYRLAGKPVPLQRPRFSSKHVYDVQAPEKEEARLQLKLQHKRTPRFSGPLKIKITFFMPIPNSYSKKKKALLLDTPHIKRPDIDNLVKWVLDCANNLLYDDDSIVYNLVVCKKYSDIPRTEFTITEIIDEKENTY